MRDVVSQHHHHHLPQQAIPDANHSFIVRFPPTMDALNEHWGVLCACSPEINDEWMRVNIDALNRNTPGGLQITSTTGTRYYRQVREEVLQATDTPMSRAFLCFKQELESRLAAQVTDPFYANVYDAGVVRLLWLFILLLLLLQQHTLRGAFRSTAMASTVARDTRPLKDMCAPTKRISRGSSSSTPRCRFPLDQCSWAWRCVAVAVARPTFTGG